MVASTMKSLSSTRPANHQARTGDDALCMCAEDAFSDAVALAEVVGIDDEMTLVHSGNSRPGHRRRFGYTAKSGDTRDLDNSA